MPATATDDWGAVRDSAVALGSISAAARAHGVTVDAACQRAKREAWPVGRRPAKALAHAREAVSAQVVRTGGVRAPTTAAVVSSELSELGKSTRLSLSRATQAAARHAEVLTGEEALTASPLTLSTIKGAAILHGWAQPGSTVGVVNINLLGMAPEQVAVEGRVVEEHVRDLPGTVPEQ